MTNYEPVPLSLPPDLYRRLAAMGGNISEHVATAIRLGVGSQQPVPMTGEQCISITVLLPGDLIVLWNQKGSGFIIQSIQNYVKGR